MMISKQLHEFFIHVFDDITVAESSLFWLLSTKWLKRTKLGMNCAERGETIVFRSAVGYKEF